MDSYDGESSPHAQDAPQGPDRSAAPLQGAAERRLLPWQRLALAAAGVVVVAGLAVGAVALAGGDDDPPPVAATSSASPSASSSASPSPTPGPTTPSPTPTEAEPEEPASPVLDACGTPAPQGLSTGDPWVGDYGGGIDGDVNVPLDLRWSVISGEDWSGRAVTATVVGLWLVTEDGAVVAVPAELPGPVPVTMNQGSEGGGGGSEGALQLSTVFLACPDGSAGLPPAPYRARVSVELAADATTQSAWGDLPVFVPDYDTATGS